MMTVAKLTRRQAAKYWTLLPLFALILSSCTPIAPWQTAKGGPNPPFADAAPLPNPIDQLASAASTDLPDTDANAALEDDDETEADTPAEETATPAEATATPIRTPTPVMPAEAISMQAALNCLASGQVVYGLALQNTNVRQETDVAACRIGRIPKGSLVRITGSLDSTNVLANVALVTASPLPTSTDTPTATPTATPTGESTVAPNEAPTAEIGIGESLDAVATEMITTEIQSSAVDRALNAIFGSNIPATTPLPTRTDSNTIALLPTPTASVTASVTASATAFATATSRTTIAATQTPTVHSTTEEPAHPAIGYVEDIQPIFNRTCSSCHSGIVQSNELQVTEYEPLMKGGKSGPPVIAGSSEASLLWTQIESGYMPLVGELNDTDKALVRDWIDAGAPEFRSTPLPTPTASATQLLVDIPRPSTSQDADRIDDTEIDTDDDLTPVERSTATPAVIVQLPQQDGAGTWSFDVAASNLPNTAESSVGPAPFAATDATWGAWLAVHSGDFDDVADSCQDPSAAPLSVVSSELILPVACGVAPSTASLDLLRVAMALPVSTPEVAAVSTPDTQAVAVSSGTAPSTASTTTEDNEVAATGDTESVTESIPEGAAAPPVAAMVGDFSASAAGISSKALGLPAPASTEGWLIPRGGFCIARQLPNNNRSITALAFAPDGRLYMGFDSLLTGDLDPLVLNDAYHPSRSIAVYDPATGNQPEIIFDESSRVTGLDFENGILWVSRAGEVGMIRDGGAFETLAGGFAVDSHLFHANNGIAVSGGYVYVSAGGVRDGYVEGPITGISEQGAQDLVSGGNPWAARIVRAPIDQLLSARSISAFTTAARGVRNPYGITVDPAGRIWWTDNGATNVPDDVRAGDEVDVMNAASAGGGEAGSPYYGFPLAIMDNSPNFVPPVVNLINSAAPTGITWAMGTIFFAQYGVDPGLYRLGESSGTVIAERVLLGWPILAVTTAPDGALWVGMGDGALYRITQGC